MGVLHSSHLSDKTISPQWFVPVDLASKAHSNTLQVSSTSLVDIGWLQVQHVSLGSQPHRVEFLSDFDTLMILDDGCFVEGERRIGDVCSTSSGPLNKGIDVIPANHQFTAIALPGSSVQGTLIHFQKEYYDDRLEKERSIISPVLDLKGNFLNVLAAQLRTAVQEERNTSYLEALVRLILKEVPRTQHLCGESTGQRGVGGLAPRARRIAKEFLNENYNNDINLTDLADMVGLSRYHFTREFKTSFGLPPHQYILNMRVQKACDFLKTTIMSITDIALEVGFSSSSDLSRSFKKIMNRTPRDFRAMHMYAGVEH